MADKKQKQDDILNADDVIKNIEDEKTSEFLGEEVKDGKVVEQPEEEIEKEEDKEPDKEEEIVEEKIDTEQLKAELKEEVTKEVSENTVNKITKALTGNEDTTSEQKDKYLAYSEKFLKEKGRNPTWFELVPFIRDEVKSELKAEQEEIVKKQEEEKKLTEETQKQRMEALNKYIDEQLDDLYKNKRLPEIKDKDNKDDEGIVARKALFQTMLEVNQERVKQKKEPIYSIKEIYYEHYKKPSKDVAGGDAPVSPGRGSASTTESPEDYSYQDIHKTKSFTDFFMKK